MPLKAHDSIMMTAVIKLPALLLVAALLAADPALGNRRPPRPPSPVSPYSPLCPKPMNSANARYKCYSTVLKAVFQAVAENDPINYFSLVPTIAPLFADNLMTRSTWATVTGSVLNAQYLSTFVPTWALSGMVNSPFTFTSFVISGDVAVTECYSTVKSLVTGMASNWSTKTFFKFNTYNKVEYWDMDYGRNQAFYESFGMLPTPDETPAFNLRPAGFICNMTATFCTGALQQYDSISSCVAYLTPLPYIPRSGDLQSNSVACRALQALLLPANPALFCPTVGPDGAGSCTDLPYDRFFDYFPPGTFIGIDPTLLN